MKKGEKYDSMTQNPENDALGFFENYNSNMKYVQGRIRELNPKRVFDIGCGTGNLTGNLSSEFKVIGIDKSFEMTVQLNNKFPLIKTINMDLEDWILSQKFSKEDLVVSSFVFHALPNKSIVFDGLLKALNVCSRLIIVDYVFESDNAESHFIQNLRNDKKNELANLVECKHYLKIDAVNDWCTVNNLNIKVNKLTHWICVLEVWS